MSTRAFGRPNGKRGISTIVGTSFFLLLLVASLGTIFVITQSVQETINVNREMIIFDTERVHERVQMTAVYLNADRQLIINATNFGTITARLIGFWLINSTGLDASTYKHLFYPLDIFLNPGESTSIASNFTLASGQSHIVKLVTERGNIDSFKLVPAIRARIFVMAPAVNPISQNITVLAVITNNDTSNNNLFDVTPTISVTTSGSLPTLKKGPEPANVALIAPGSSALFRWTYQAPTDESVLVFNVSFTGAPSGVWETSRTEVVLIGESLTQYAKEIVGLRVVPESPGPIHASSAAEGKWGITIVNPFDRPVRVYSVAFVSSIDQAFGDTTPTGINPSTGWTQAFPHSSSAIVQWASSTGELVAARSVGNFTVQFSGEYGPAVSSSKELREHLIQVEALTSDGKFVTSTPITTKNSYPMMLLYYTKTPSTPTADWGYAINGIKAGSTHTFNVTIENASPAATNPMDSPITLMIIVPTGWTNVSAASGQTGWGTPAVTTNTDRSTTINVTTSASTFSEGSSLVFQYNVTAPAVTATTLYIFETTAIYPSSSIVPLITSTRAPYAVQVIP